MKDVYSKDAAVSRVQGMLENIRSIRQSAIDNHNITFSVGVAFSSDQGMRFDDLYRSADKALYQSKQGGRDSFTVYEKV